MDEVKLAALAEEFREYARRIDKMGASVQKAREANPSFAGTLLHLKDLRNKFMSGIEDWLDDSEVDTKSMVRSAANHVQGPIEATWLQSQRRKEKPAKKTSKTKKSEA